MGGQRFTAPDRLSAPERRRYPRVAVSQPATVDLGLRRGAALLDVSENGVRVRAACHPVQGIVTSLSLTLPGTLAPIRTMATVAWTDGSGNMGLVFRGLSEDHRQQLAGWVSHPQQAEWDDKAGGEPSKPIDAAVETCDIDAAELDPLTAAMLQTALPRLAALTAATGAAVAMERAGAIVCVATWGNAPALNTIVERQSGLSGECIRTREVVRCEDTESDSRTDPLLCRELNLRSIVIAPLLQQERVFGVVEVHSNVPYAFNSTHLALLMRVAGLLGSLRHVGAGPMPAEPKSVIAPLPAGAMAASPAEDAAVPGIVPREPSPPEPPPSVEVQPGQPVQAAANIGSVGAVGAPGALRTTAARPSARAQLRPPRREKKAGPSCPGPQRPTRFQRTAGMFKTLIRSALVVWFTTALGLGGLIAYRQTVRTASPPASGGQSSTTRATDPLTTGGLAALGTRMDDAKARLLLLVRSLRSGLTEVAPPETLADHTAQHLTGGKLLEYVQPVYPEAARTQKLLGPVILRVQVGKTGRVQRMEVLRGPPLLASAAKEAVRRWRYEPFRVDGDPIEMQTVVTVPFAVPQP